MLTQKMAYEWAVQAAEEAGGSITVAGLFMTGAHTFHIRAEFLIEPSQSFPAC